MTWTQRCQRQNRTACGYLRTGDKLEELLENVTQIVANENLEGAVVSRDLPRKRIRLQLRRDDRVSERYSSSFDSTNSSKSSTSSS